MVIVNCVCRANLIDSNLPKSKVYLIFHMKFTNIPIESIFPSCFRTVDKNLLIIFIYIHSNKIQVFLFNVYLINLPKHLSY